MERKSKSSEFLSKSGIFFLLCFVILIEQVRSGCFSAEFGDDESAHYVSGLLIHDYILSGFHLSPLQYLKWYHSHYPVVGIGHWGPAFYGIEALWMLVFTPGRVSVLLLSTVTTAATAALIYYYGSRRLKLSRLASLFAAAAFCICPIIQEGSSAMMLDNPITLFTFLAFVTYSRYVATERWVYSILFGLLAATAMLIKGNGALLVLVPPLVVIMNGKWFLLRRGSFWAPLPLVGLLVGPWYALTYGQIAVGFRYAWGLDYSRTALVDNSKILFSMLGPMVTILILAGLIFKQRHASEDARSEFKNTIALLVAVWAFQTVVPAAIQDRYLAPLLPSAFLLAALGGEFLAALVARHTSFANARALVFSIAALSLAPFALNIEIKPQQGLRDLAALVWRDRPKENPVVLIAASERAEVAAVAELAMADPDRPSLFAVRGSRLLGGGGYNRQDYIAKFADARDVAAQLETTHVPLVLYQADPGGWAHVAQIDAVRRDASPSWQLLATIDSANGPASLYRLPEADGVAADQKYWVELSTPKALK